MTAMWQSSWFWLMICTLLLILAGCAIFSSNAFRREVDNSHLIYQTVTPFPTFLPPDSYNPANPLMMIPDTLPLHQRSTAPPGNYIVVDTPTCFSLPGGEYSCLGQIWNNTGENMGDTEIQLDFYDIGGRKIGEQRVTSEQRLTLPGESAPYRAIVSAELADNTQVLTSVVDTLPPADNLRLLRIEEAWEDLTASGSFHLSVRIHNNTGYTARNIRLFAILDGAEWGTVAYTVNEVENFLNNDERQLLEVEVIPHAIPQRIQPILHVEAIISD